MKIKNETKSVKKKKKNYNERKLSTTTSEKPSDWREGDSFISRQKKKLE